MSKRPAPNDNYGEYFAEEDAPAAPPPRRKRSRMPVCTDACGNPILRLGPTSLRRVLEDLRNVTSTSPCNYASLYCEERGVSLAREGASTQSALYSMCACHPAKLVTLRGAAGRDELIRRFLKLLRSGKSYAPPETPDPCLAERAESPHKKRKKR